MVDQGASNAELVRCIENIVRAGTVAAVDHATARCRISSGGLSSDWLPWISMRAGDVRRWSPPSVGEQCVVFSPGGNTAAALALVGIFSAGVPANGNSADVERTTYPDGAVIEYDHAAHALNATLPAGGTAEITAPVSVTVHSDAITLDAPKTTVTGELTVHGLLTWVAGMLGSGASGAGAEAVITGTIRTSEDVIAGSISLGHHDHVDGVGAPV